MELLKNKFFQASCVSLFILLLSACYPPITVDQLHSLRPGYSVNEVMQVTQRPAQTEKDVVYNNQVYLAQIMPVQGSGNTTKTVCEPVNGCTTTTVSAGVSASTMPYVLIYQKNNGSYKLYAWGTFEELSSSSDPVLRKISQALLQHVQMKTTVQ